MAEYLKELSTWIGKKEESASLLEEPPFKELSHIERQWGQTSWETDLLFESSKRLSSTFLAFTKEQQEKPFS